MDRPFQTYSDALTSPIDPVEMYHILNGNEAPYTKALASADLEGPVNRIISNIKNWLPGASEPYNISRNLKDYIMIPVAIMPSELPNRNGVAFPHEELTRFNTDVGCLAYNTFTGKPTHVEHNNKVLDAAKGVILDSAYKKIPNTKNIWKVIVLLGFDRTKDPSLVQEILDKKRTCYSMGAFVKDYKCSICNVSLSSGGCGHLTPPGRPPKFKIFNGNQLAYYRAIDPLGFETSSVAVPAYSSAENPKVISF